MMGSLDGSGMGSVESIFLRINICTRNIKYVIINI